MNERQLSDLRASRRGYVLQFGRLVLRVDLGVGGNVDGVRRSATRKLRTGWRDESSWSELRTDLLIPSGQTFCCCEDAMTNGKRAGTALSAVESARDAIVDLISTQQYLAGDRLPSERDLAALLGVGRTSLREALAHLERTGYVTRRPGRGGGTFVNKPKVERDLTSLTGLPDHLRRQGRASSAKVLSARLMTSDSWTAAELQLAEGAMVYEIIRLRLSDGEPLSLERSRFPADAFAGMLERPLGGSLYAILREEYGTAPFRARESLEPVVAGPSDAETFGIEVGEPMLSVQRVTFDESGRPIEVGHDLFRGDRTRVTVWVEASKDAPLEVRGEMTADLAVSDEIVPVRRTAVS
jgi:GntR family transcriptional regulator